MSYDFMTLSPEDFEALSADLLSKEWASGSLEIFKSGKDSGIDLRHSRTPKGQPKVIIQCKRYAPSRFSALERSLKEERSKLEKLQPERYVIVTSVPLSAHQKDKLLEVISPWCKGPQDIYGCDELNGLLRQHPSVITAHFKLWISGTQVLRQILHADVFALSTANLDIARDLISRLVVHDGVNEALEVLEQRRHLLILGNPGIGKSTLARMMMSRYVADGYEAVWTTTVRDAWRVLGEPRDDARKLFLVLDDFLGRVRFNESKLKQDEDRSLFALMDTAARSSHLRIVLTTREYILEEAKRASGLLDERGRDMKKYTLLLKKYSDAHRARMVFNHLYFSDLPDSRLEAFVASRAYRTIVAHRHFSPRVVESISKAANSQSLTDEEFLEYVTNEFENPKDLWRHPFENEISPLARLLLAVLWTFDGRTSIREFQLACSRLQTNTPEEERQLEFEKALKQLDGNFLQINQSEPWESGTELRVSFQNPSVEEFVEQRLGSDSGMLRVSLGAVLFFRQISNFLEYLTTHEASMERENLLDLYSALRERAYEVINPRADQFLALSQAPISRSQRLTFDRSGPVDRVWVLLKLDKAVDACDDRGKAVCEALVKPTYWFKLMKHVCGWHYTANTLKHLAHWIRDDSEWPTEDVGRCLEAMRYAFYQLLLDKDLVLLKINAIEELIDGFWTVADNWPSPVEHATLDKALASIVDSLVQESSSNVDEVASERQSLELIQIILGQKYVSEMNKLEQFEIELRMQEEERKLEKSDDFFLAKSEEACVDISIDELFSSLAER